jgi:monoamine oxidase
VPAAQTSLLGLALEPEAGRGLRIRGGAERLVAALATHLGNHLALRTPVVRLRPRPGAVLVESGGGQLLAGRVVLAVPLWARGPARVPGPRVARYGIAVKSLLRFAAPLPATPDAVISDGPLGYARATGSRSVVAFTGGRAAALLSRLRPAERDRLLATAARATFGAWPEAITSVAWPRCTLALAPGQLTAWGETLREPRGRVHLAGSEASDRPSLVEGAVRAGERAAREVLEAG